MDEVASDEVVGDVKVLHLPDLCAVVGLAKVAEPAKEKAVLHVRNWEKKVKGRKLSSDVQVATL